MNDREATIKRLQKVLALARQGVGGEKDNAERLLTKLLARHGLALGDLEDAAEVPQRYWFRPKSKYENALLDGIVASTVKDYNGKVWGLKGKGQRRRGYDLRKAEFAEISIAFDVHRAALEKKLHQAMLHTTIAYNQTNGLHSGKPPSDDEPSSLSDADIEAIMAIMRRMDPTPVFKSLEHK